MVSFAIKTVMFKKKMFIFDSCVLYFFTGSDKNVKKRCHKDGTENN